MVYFLVYRRLQTQVHQLQKLEKSLRQSEADFRGIVEDQTEFICRFTANAKISFINQAFAKTTGESADSLIGKDFLSWFFPEDTSLVKDQISRLTRNHPIETGEYRLKSPEGNPRWISWTIRAIYNPSSELPYFQSVGRETTDYYLAMQTLREALDVLEIKVQQSPIELERINQEMRTEILIRKSAENALKESESHLQQLVNQIPAILWTMDKELNLTSLQGSQIPEHQSQFKQLLQSNLKESITSGNTEKPEIKAHLDAFKGTA